MKRAALAFLLFMVVVSSCISASFAGLEPSVLIYDGHEKLEVGTTSDDVWAQLVQLHQNGSWVLIGGVVEAYDNEWGYRFAPDTVEVWVDHVADSWLISHLGAFLGEFAWTFARVISVFGSPDVNWDGIVNVTDLTIISFAYGSFEGEPDYLWIADINEDGIVDMRDMSTVARHLGETDQ